MRRSIAIVGAGGHARSVAGVIFSLSEYRLVAFLDTPLSEGEEIFGVPVRDLPEPISELLDTGLDCLAFGQGNSFLRSKQMDQLASLSKSFSTLIHPNAYVGHDVKVGAGTVVMPGVTLNVSAHIGMGCIINTGSIVEHGTVVGDFSNISPRAAIASDVTIGSHVFVGIGAVVSGKITIGDNTVVGAGAVVVNDLEPGILAVGVPARRVRAIPPGWSPV